MRSLICRPGLALALLLAAPACKKKGPATYRTVRMPAGTEVIDLRAVASNAVVQRLYPTGNFLTVMKHLQQIFAQGRVYRLPDGKLAFLEDFQIDYTMLHSGKRVMGYFHSFRYPKESQPELHPKHKPRVLWRSHTLRYGSPGGSSRRLMLPKKETLRVQLRYSADRLGEG